MLRPDRLYPLTLLLAASLVVLLAAQQRSLRGQLDDATTRADWPYPGFIVPAFDAVTLRGDSVSIGAAEAGNSQVIFFFDVDCPYCLETLPQWRRIARSFGEDPAVGVEVYGVSLSPEEETRAYRREHRLPFPIVHLPEGRMLELYRVRGTPLTMVLDDAGVVRHARFASLAAAPAAVDSVVAAAKVASVADG